MVFRNSTIVTGEFVPANNTAGTAIATVPHNGGNGGNGGISVALSSLIGVAAATVIIVGTALGIGRLIKFFNQVSAQ